MADSFSHMLRQGAPDELAGDERTILIVDDDPAVREWLGTALALEGYRVIKAADGFEAIELFEEHRPDLVLLDIMMPRMSGFEVLDRLSRAANNESKPPVIILSALGSDQDQWEGYRRGAATYLPKPVEATELLQAVTTLLS